MTIPDSPTISIRDAAPLLGISTSTAYAAVKAGTFPVPVIHIGSRISVPTAPLRKLLGIDTDETPTAVA